MYYFFVKNKKLNIRVLVLSAFAGVVIIAVFIFNEAYGFGALRPCFDSDGGITLEEQGITRGLYGTIGRTQMTDYCTNDQVVEYSCIGNWIQYHPYDCPAETECVDGACISDSNTISIAAIKLSRNDYSIENLENKLNSLFANHPDVDLVITPEYIFYDDDDYKENGNDNNA